MNDIGDREKYRQRARRPHTEAGEAPVSSKYVAEVFGLVPEIGNGYRWYDYPYRILWWLAYGWRAKVLRGRVRTWIFKGINCLSIYNDHDRNKAWSLEDPYHNVFVPDDEHVNVAGIWLVELFPPTELPALERALKRNGWGGSRAYTVHQGGNHELLKKARAGGGAYWWSLVDVVKKDSKWFVPDGLREHLPAEFEHVGLRAVQVGAGLTAVIAAFHLNQEASMSLDAEWHRQHQPILRKGKGRPRSLDRQWATFWEVQSERRRLHYAARTWLADRLPGFFSASEEPLPLLDLLLFDHLDPTADRPDLKDRDEAMREHANQTSDALRALGLRKPVFDMLLSESLPKLVLSQLDGHLHEALGEDPTWTLWGSRPAVVKALGEDELRYSGNDENRAIANRLVHGMSNLFVMLAVSQYLTVTERRYAAIRDRASTRHGKFRPRALTELRKEFLTLSLNLASIERDTTAFWARPWRWDGDAKFYFQPSPSERARNRDQATDSHKPTSFNESLKESHEKWFSRLIDADRAYRDILSTVASLGASADSYRMGRLALIVAVASVVVAVAAVGVADVGSDSLWVQLSETVTGWFAG